jgi:hypothetical protein
MTDRKLILLSVGKIQAMATRGGAMKSVGSKIREAAAQCYE